MTQRGSPVVTGVSASAGPLNQNVRQTKPPGLAFQRNSGVRVEPFLQPLEALASKARGGDPRAFVSEMLQLSALRQPAAIAAPGYSVMEVKSVLRRCMARQFGVDRAWRRATNTRRLRGRRLHISGGGGTAHGDPIIMLLNL